MFNVSPLSHSYVVSQALMMRIEDLKEDHQSKYQHVQVFTNKTWGNTLVLDGCIQYTEKDQVCVRVCVCVCVCAIHSWSNLLFH
jgi:spermidine synthase